MIDDEDRGHKRDETALRLHHLLVWMAIAAVLLTIGRLVIESWNHARPHAPVATPSLWTAVTNILFAGQICIGSLAISWRQRRLVDHIEPGEWMAIANGTVGVAILLHSLSTVAIVSLYGIQWFVGHMTWLTIPSTGLEVVLLAIFGRQTLSSDESWPWRLAYGTLAIQRGIGIAASVLVFAALSQSYVAIFEVMYLVQRVVYWMLAASIIGALSWDIWKRPHRRWTHWSGAILTVAVAVGNFML